MTLCESLDWLREHSSTLILGKDRIGISSFFVDNNTVGLRLIRESITGKTIEEAVEKAVQYCKDKNLE